MTKLKKMLFLKFARKFNKNAEAVPVPSIISENTKIAGDIISKGIVHVDGRVEGDITCEELRSEERRVGKECRSRWSPYH